MIATAIITRKMMMLLLVDDDQGDIKNDTCDNNDKYNSKNNTINDYDRTIVISI